MAFTLEDVLEEFSETSGLGREWFDHTRHSVIQRKRRKEKQPRSARNPGRRLTWRLEHPVMQAWCEVCGVGFRTADLRKKFCAPECRYIARLEKKRKARSDKRCLWCGGMLPVQYRFAGAKRTKFCARACSSRFHNKARWRRVVADERLHNLRLLEKQKQRGSGQHLVWHRRYYEKLKTDPVRYAAYSKRVREYQRGKRALP